MAEMMAKGTDVAGKVAPGKAVGEDSLSGAVRELQAQHPIKWNNLGPHHSGGGKIARGGKLHQSGG